MSIHLNPIWVKKHRVITSKGGFLYFIISKKCIDFQSLNKHQNRFYDYKADKYILWCCNSFNLHICMLEKSHIYQSIIVLMFSSFSGILTWEYSKNMLCKIFHMSHVIDILIQTSMRIWIFQCFRIEICFNLSFISTIYSMIIFESIKKNIDVRDD